MRTFHSTVEYFFWHNRLGTRVSESLLYNQRESALFVVPEESWSAHFMSCGADFLWRLKLVNQTELQQVTLFYDWQTTTDWTTNLRQESDKLVYGSLHLLALGWTVVKRAPCRWCSHRTQGHASSGTCPRQRIPGCTVQWSLRCAGRWAHKPVRGSYSARVPKSSLARVCRVLVPYIMEDEAEDPENENDDRREGRQQEMEGRTAESQNNHTMSAWRWDGVKRALHAKLDPWATCVIHTCCDSTRKCDVWGVLATGFPTKRIELFRCCGCLRNAISMVCAVKHREIHNVLSVRRVTADEDPLLQEGLMNDSPTGIQKAFHWHTKFGIGTQSTKRQISD